MYDNLEEALRASTLAPDRRDPRDRDGEGARRRAGAPRLDAARSSRTLADRVFRTQFLVLTYQGGAAAASASSRSRLFLVVGSLRGHPRQPHAGRVRRVQRARRARERTPLLLLLLLWDQLQLAQDPARPPRRRARAGARAGRRPLRAPRRVDARRRASSCANVGFRYGGPEAPPILEGHHASRSSRARRSRSSAAAAPARRR